MGLGFEVFENWVYSLSMAFQSIDDPWHAVGVSVLLRGVVGAFSHAVWTGILGAAIGWAATGAGAGRVVRVLVAMGTFVLVVVLHGVEDWSASEFMIAVTLLNDLVGVVILVVLILRLQRGEEHRLTSLALADGGWGVVDTTALTADADGHAGRKRRRHELRYAYTRDQCGPDAPLTTRAVRTLG